MTNKILPIFITETGWSADVVPDDTRVQYYQQTFNTIWNDKDIVAITPFLLQASAGPFQKFSFLTTTGAYTKQYNLFASMPKVKGVPSFPTRSVLGSTDKKLIVDSRNFSDFKFPKRSFSVVNVMDDVFNFIIGN